jgi:hypothetical protein
MKIEALLILRRYAPVVLAAVALTATQLRADTTVPNTNSGWITSTGTEQSNNPTYSSGFMYGEQFDNYFTFNLSGVSGTITGATFNVETYSVVGSGIFSIYSTSLTPTEAEQNPTNPYFSDLTSGTLIGLIPIDSTEHDQLLAISLNSAGLSWLQANEGNLIVLGGAYIAPGSITYAFGQSKLNSNNALDIQTGGGEATVTPEPGSFLLLGSGLIGLVGMVRRKIGLRA